MGIAIGRIPQKLGQLAHVSDANGLKSESKSMDFSDQKIYSNGLIAFPGGLRIYY
jgi:hypothetical protein